jgi:hypothetical protein
VVNGHARHVPGGFWQCYIMRLDGRQFCRQVVLCLIGCIHESMFGQRPWFSD